jgi:hypothetical protein
VFCNNPFTAVLTLSIIDKLLLFHRTDSGRNDFYISYSDYEEGPSKTGYI